MMTLAYIDAGMGAMLLQWIIAFVIGAGVFFRHTVIGFFRRLFGKKNEEQSENKQETEEQETEEKI